MSPPNVELNFFGQLLARRHLLTRRSLWVAALLCPVPVLLGYQFLSNNRAHDVVQTQGVAASEVRTLRVATSPLSSAGPEFLTHEFTGVVVPRRSSRLASKAVGRVDSITVDIGDHVVRGQVLIELDHAELDAARGVANASLANARSRLQELERGPRAQDIEQAQARVTELAAAFELQRANYFRKTRLQQLSAITRQEFDESKFALDASVAQLDAAKQALELLVEGTREEQKEMQRATVAGLESQLERIAADRADRSIMAPFTGEVKSRFLDEGSIVSPGQSLIEIVEAAPYDVRVGLPDELRTDMVDSDVFVFTGNQKLTATIERIAPTIDEATRTREIILRLSESSSKLVSLGSAVTVTVQKRSVGEGYWVPTKSLTSGSRGLWAVFIAMPTTDADGLNAGKHVIERRQVELLRSHGDWSQVQGPLSQDELLVVAGVHRVTPGQIVESGLQETHYTTGSDELPEGL
jgi:RND family efflux transporter MFP subunit